MISRVKCNKCEVVVEPTPPNPCGCGCDPDAPTWIAYLRSGEFFKMSNASYSLVNHDD